MRVISGTLKGRKIEGYEIKTTRPTMDRVKESIFDSLQDNIISSTVLDLFCGTGSLGIEALSRGAKECYFVDNNKDILLYLNQNINNLKLKNKSIILDKDYLEALKYLKNNNLKFNLILVDAPYKMQVIEKIINLVLDYDLLANKGILVLEYSFDKLKESYPQLNLYKYKKYGNKYVSIYRKEENNE